MKVRHIDWYADEWLVGTAQLTAEERGIYITICCLIYSRGGPIPDVERDLARLCNCHWRTFRATRNRLLALGKIVSEEAHVDVRRCSREIEKALRRSSEASQNAVTRWSKDRNLNDIANADAVQDRNANHQPTNHQPYTRVPARGRFANGKNHDPWGHEEMTEDQLCARFNDKAVKGDERDALRYRLLGH